MTSDQCFSYRFGFNGKEMDNEVQGQGNAYDFGARIYDSRLGRFLSIDPDYRKYPYWSPYLVSRNDPIRCIDLFGKGPGDKVIMFSGALLVPGVQTVTPTMDYIMDKVGDFSGEVSMYHTAYPLGVIDFNDEMIESAVADIEAWQVANPNGKLSIVGYSYGGVAATELAKALNKKGIAVDLLVTLDAADGEAKVDRTIPSNVVKNINYYQTNGKKTGSRLKDWIGSKGGKNKREKGNSSTEIINIDETNKTYKGKDDYYKGIVNHYNIDDKNQDNIVSDIQESQEENNDVKATNPPISKCLLQ